MFFTMVEENFGIWHSEMIHIDRILRLFSDKNLFTMVEENFEISNSKMLQKVNWVLLISEDSFTMVEEKNGIWHSEKLQIDWILLLCDKDSFKMVLNIFSSFFNMKRFHTPPKCCPKFSYPVKREVKFFVPPQHILHPPTRDKKCPPPLLGRKFPF